MSTNVLGTSFQGVTKGVFRTAADPLPRGPKDQKNSRFRSRLKISIENEIFERATHRGPIFCGEIETSRLKFSSEIKNFDRDQFFWSLGALGSGDPRRAPEKQTVRTVTASQKMLTLQALSSSLNAGAAKGGPAWAKESMGILFATPTPTYKAKIWTKIWPPNCRICLVLKRLGSYFVQMFVHIFALYVGGGGH